MAVQTSVMQDEIRLLSRLLDNGLHYKITCTLCIAFTEIRCRGLLAHPCALPRLVVEKHVAALFRLSTDLNGFAVALIFGEPHHKFFMVAPVAVGPFVCLLAFPFLSFRGLRRDITALWRLVLA